MSADLASSCKLGVPSFKFKKNCILTLNLQNAYEESKVSEDIFPSLLRYMESIKGGMRQGAMDIARLKVEKGTKWEVRQK